MFEHMKNYEVLLCKISSWLRPNPNPLMPDFPKAVQESAGNGREGESLLFVQMFVHRDKPYHFEEDEGWMGRTFFSGMCPCLGDLIPQPINF
jgi:hypothetical protein